MRHSAVVTLRTLAAAAAAAVVSPAFGASGEWTPSKPVRMIVGFPPGGATDLVARQIAPKMGQGLGRQVIVDNRPGANGVISNELIMRADPDGHTIGFGHIGTLVISPAIQKVPYNVYKDLAPVGMVVSLQNIIVVTPSLPAKTVKEYVALAKSKPGSMLFGSSGNGSPGHLAAVLLETMSGANLTHVPYKGGGPMITDLVGGQIPSAFAVISTGLPHVRSGKVRALAVTGEKRAAAAPTVPTVAESGYKGYAATNWYGMLAPAATPANIIERLNHEMNAALRSPEIVNSLRDSGIDAAPSTPADFFKFVQTEEKKWAPIIKKSNIKVD
ncbi:MAG TPA: tripartite tricarboxylate transporter substrate binding protein [Burkholderiales bacterium]|nr:tripartite tricarboxylate transporter substrate binding protein [Burkholderiales bacterium]